jgi:hypothetical protein
MSDKTQSTGESTRELFEKSLASGTSLPAPRPRRDHITIAVILALSILATFVVSRSAKHVLYPYAIDTGEGTILDAAWRASLGKSMYNVVGDAPPYFFTIYNPVLPYLSGLALRFTGPDAAPARIITVLFYAAAAFVVYLFVRRETASRSAAAVAMLFFLVERHLYARAGYLVTDWPAIFFSLLGLYLWRPGGVRRWWAILAFALAFFSKQTFVIAAAAAFASLFLEGKRLESVKLFAAFAAVVAAGIGILSAIFGRAYLTNVFYYAGIAPLEIHRSMNHVGTAVALYFVPVVAWFVFAWKSIRDRSHLLVVIYFVFGLGIAFMSGKVGASRSYLFDFAAALSIIAGLVWAKVEARTCRGALSFPAFTVVVLQIFLIAIGTTYRLSPLGDRTESDRLKDTAISDAFSSVDGLVLTRETGFDFGSRAHAVSDDPYKLMQMIENGNISMDVLLDPVAARRFALVIMPVKEGPWRLFTDELRSRVLQNYSVVREEHGLLFLTPLSDEKAGNDRPVTP